MQQGKFPLSSCAAGLSQNTVDPNLMTSCAAGRGCFSYLDLGVKSCAAGGSAFQTPRAPSAPPIRLAPRAPPPLSPAPRALAATAPRYPNPALVNPLRAGFAHEQRERRPSADGVGRCGPTAAALPLTKIQAQGAAKAAFAALSFSIKDGRLKDVCVDLHQATWTSFENALATIRAVFRSATPPTELMVVQPRAQCQYAQGSGATPRRSSCSARAAA